MREIPTTTNGDRKCPPADELALTLILRNETLGIRAIQKIVGLSRGGVASLLKRAMVSGRVERFVDPREKRRHLYKLATTGLRERHRARDHGAPTWFDELASLREENAILKERLDEEAATRQELRERLIRVLNILNKLGIEE